MLKQISAKKAAIALAVVAAVVGIAAIVFFGRKDSDSYRSILVYELAGNATIDRADAGSINAVENLYLESGDRVKIAEDSSMRLKLDDDKYVMAEENTIFSVEAQGDSENSRTKILLEQGAITNEIQNPLREGAVFETSTPNSVMAVRGTIYRAAMNEDDGSMGLAVFDGTVAANPVFPDGNLGEEVLVPAGYELVIYSDGTVEGPRAIVFENFPEQTLFFLSQMMESGSPIKGIEKDALETLIEKSKEPKAQQVDDAQAEEGGLENADAAAPTVSSDLSISGDVPSASAKADQKRQSNQKKDSGKNNRAKAQPDEEETELPAKPVVESVLPAPAADNSGGGSDENNDSYSNEGSTDEWRDQKTEPHNPRPERPKPELDLFCQVTYEYNGETFATQTIFKGTQATKPTLSPAASGDWNFDFGTPIMSDTTIQWSE